MEIQISKGTQLRLKDFAKRLDISERELIEKAILLYFKDINNSMDLQDEIKMWEQAGMNDLNNFKE